MDSETFNASHPFDLDLMIDESVAKILATEDADSFCRWLERTIGRYASSAAWEVISDPRARASLASGLGRAIWNATPLPGNGFEPQPISEPRPGESCSCGSRYRYRDCCGRLGIITAVPVVSSTADKALSVN